jgi:hypothetical protein
MTSMKPTMTYVMQISLHSLTLELNYSKIPSWLTTTSMEDNCKLQQNQTTFLHALKEPIINEI